MELTQLRYFCDVAQTEHMTRSARRLSVAQPALTRSIHRLEDELGVALFEHVGRNIRLTAEGERLQGRVAPLLASLDEAAEEVRAFSAERSRVVRVAVLSASGVVVDAIASFAERHREASFEVVQGSDASRCDVRVDTLLPPSLAAAPAQGRPAPPAAEARFREAIGVAVPSSSGLAGPVALSDLRDERFICLAGSRRFRGLCDALCAQRGFFPTVGFDSDSPAVVKKMIGLGLGLGFWPERSWGTLEGSGARWASLAEEGFERTVAVTLAAHAQPEGMAAAFYGFLTDAMGRAWGEGA